MNLKADSTIICSFAVAQCDTEMRFEIEVGVEINIHTWSWHSDQYPHIGWE